MFKFKVKSLDEVEEQYHSLYKKVGDWFVFQVEGAVDEADLTIANNKIKEFRDNNVALNTKIQEFEGKKTLSEEELEEYEGLKERQQQIEDKKLIDAGKIDEVVTQRTERMRSEHANQISSITQARDTAIEERDNYRGRLSGVLVESAIMEAIGDVAVPLKGASSDIMGRARSVWKVNEQGELEALNADGTAVYETDGTTALQMSTFAQDMIKSAPFLFEKSSGGGGGGGHKRPNGGDDVKTLASSDQKAIGKNLEKIASGEIEVVD